MSRSVFSWLVTVFDIRTVLKDTDDLTIQQTVTICYHLSPSLFNWPVCDLIVPLVSRQRSVGPSPHYFTKCVLLYQTTHITNNKKKKLVTSWRVQKSCCFNSRVQHRTAEMRVGFISLYSPQLLQTFIIKQREQHTMCPARQPPTPDGGADSILMTSSVGALKEDRLPV